MNILLAGGSGFIGENLTNLLVQENHKVYILSRQKSLQTNFSSNQNIYTLYWDGKSLGEWTKSVSEMDVVINLAGENIGGKNIFEVFTKRWTKETKDSLKSSRINTGKVLVEAIRNAERKPATFIQASAVGYYGDGGNDDLTENRPPGNDFLAKLCVEWEMSTQEVESLGVRRIILRIGGVVMSLKGGSLPMLLFPFKFYLGGPLGNGSQWMSWIHIHDLTRAILFLINHPEASGVYNLCAPHPLTNKQLASIIGKIMHKPSFLPIPKFIFKFLLGEKSSILLTSQKQIPEKLLKLGFNFNYPQAEDALRNLLEK